MLKNNCIEDETCAKQLQYQDTLKPTGDTESESSDSDFDTTSCNTDTFIAQSPVTARKTLPSESPGLPNSQGRPMMFPIVKVRQCRTKIYEKVMRSCWI